MLSSLIGCVALPFGWTVQCAFLWLSHRMHVLLLMVFDIFGSTVVGHSSPVTYHLARCFCKLVAWYRVVLKEMGMVDVPVDRDVHGTLMCLFGSECCSHCVGHL